MHQQFARLRPAFEGRRICITGGAGFIGSHLVDALVDLGAHVRVIDDLSNGLETNLQRHLQRQMEVGAGDVFFIRGSILDEPALRAALEGVEVVFHQAALGSVPQSIEKPAMYHEVNATGTLRVLEAARAAGVRRVVYAASSSAYGDSEELPKRERFAPSPKSPYAATKLAGEHLMSAYAGSLGLSTISLRYFNIFGTRQRPDSAYAAVIPAFIRALREGRRPMIFGDGTQSRDFTHIANAVFANLLAAASDQNFAGEAVNIGCGEAFTLLELLDTLGELLGRRVEPELCPPRPGDVLHSRADITLARQLLGYEPIVGLRQGLELTIDD